MPQEYCLGTPLDRLPSSLTAGAVDRTAAGNR